MPEAAASGGPTDDILAQAADWFAVLAGSPSEQDQARWRQWLQADTRHAQAWHRVEALNQRFEDMPQSVDRRAARLALERTRQAQGRRRTLRALAGVGMVGASTFLAYRQQPWQTWQADAGTSVGEQREMTLADGTRLWLNTDTAIQVGYTERDREVRLLRGELMVVTADDASAPARPWRLRTAAGLACPMGTRFGARQSGGECEVSVFEGRVDLFPADGAEAVQVHAGRRRHFDRHGVGADTGLPPSADSWTRGMLVVEGWTMAALCSELDRYQRGMLTCAADAAALRVVGAFPLRDLDQVYRTLERTLPVEVQRPLPGWVRIKAA